MRNPQPMQPVVEDAHGDLRFRENAIISYIIDHAGLDLGKLMEMDFPQEDREQFAQLMGYSIGGYHELSYVSDESCAQASTLSDHVRSGSGGCRDDGCPIHGGPLFDDEGRRLT
jgi:hypothetical protein